MSSQKFKAGRRLITLIIYAFIASWIIVQILKHA